MTADTTSGEKEIGQAADATFRMNRIIKNTPPRLEHIFQNYDPPLYFITFCAMRPLAVLATDAVHEAFVGYVRLGEREGRAVVGRYVLMPDHAHLFVRLGQGERLGLWIRGLRRVMGKAVIRREDAINVWQPGFFDHILRGNESYSEKWAYLRDNPVRAGLVVRAEDWPYQGELFRIDRV